MDKRFPKLLSIEERVKLCNLLGLSSRAFVKRILIDIQTDGTFSVNL
jgi:hypothetical protein